MTWTDASRRLSLSLVAGSRMLPPTTRAIDVRVAATQERRRIAFDGTPVDLRL